jgi:uncharacterized membrane protein
MPGIHHINSGFYLLNDGMPFFNSPYFWISKLIGLAVIIIGIVIIVKAMKKRKSFFIENTSEAIQLLKLKYVNGEIEEEEYKKKILLLK